MSNYSVEYYVTKAADREVPGHLIHSLAQYIYNGRPTGGFLEAVLQSDLFDAFRRGDEESLRGLRNLVMFLYNDAPVGCWGTRDEYRTWIKKGGLKTVLGG